MRYLSFLLLACLTIHARLIAAPQAASFDNLKTRKVDGIVINAQTGHPLPHVLVELDGSTHHAALTDADGHFTFADVPRAAFITLHARKPGFFDQGNSYTSVVVDPKASSLELKLVPEASIFGQVTDRDGEPLEDASIQAIEVKFPEGRRQLAPVREVRTDEDGNFRMAGLQAGRYYLLVRSGTVARRILGLQSANGGETYPALVYFPSAGDLAGATPIDLGAGQKAHAEFSLSRGPAFKLTGTVSGVSAYKQVTPPMIVDETQHSLFTASSWNNRTGAFEFPALPAGTYTLQVYAVDSNDHGLQVTERVTVDKNVMGLNIALNQSMAISIVVRNEFGPQSPSHNCSGGFSAIRRGEEVDCSQVPITMTLMSVDTGRFQVNAQPISKENPSLQLSGVMPGKYVVRVMSLVGGHVHSVRCGGVDLLREALIVPAGGQSSPIEVVLRDDGGSVKVQVHSDKQSQSGRILLLAEFAPNLIPVILDIDPTGNREYGGLAPGNYKVFAFDSIEGIEYGNPEAMEKYASKSATVTVTPNGNAAVSVDLIHPGDD
jgi:Carboxypeptidase regulatory-like domain